MISLDRHPLPTEPAAVPAWARKMAVATTLDFADFRVEEARSLSRADRTANIHSLGVFHAVLAVLVEAEKRGATVPLNKAERMQWLHSRCQRCPAPPAAVFSPSIDRSLPVIYRAGIEAGLIAAMEGLTIPAPAPVVPTDVVYDKPQPITWRGMGHGLRPPRLRRSGQAARVRPAHRPPGQLVSGRRARRQAAL